MVREWPVFYQVSQLLLVLPEFKNNCMRVSHSETSITPTSAHSVPAISHHLTWLAPYVSWQIPDAEGTPLTPPFNPEPPLTPLPRIHRHLQLPLSASPPTGAVSDLGEWHQRPIGVPQTRNLSLHPFRPSQPTVAPTQVFWNHLHAVWSPLVSLLHHGIPRA